MKRPNKKDYKFNSYEGDWYSKDDKKSRYEGDLEKYINELESKTSQSTKNNDLLGIGDVSIALSGFMDWLWLNHNILTNADNNKIALEKYLATL